MGSPDTDHCRHTVFGALYLVLHRHGKLHAPMAIAMAMATIIMTMLTMTMTLTTTGNSVNKKMVTILDRIVIRIRK